MFTCKHWVEVSSRHPRLLAIVDGLPPFCCSPHYSRQTPYSGQFAGIGRKLTMVSKDRCAAWSVIEQLDPGGNLVWRNNLFRNISSNVLSSELIADATEYTYHYWKRKWGLPQTFLRTEIHVSKIKSQNPGCCYKIAGWKQYARKKDLLFFRAP